MKLANEHKLKTIAFPAISTGVYGYPFGEAADVGAVVLLARVPCPVGSDGLKLPPMACRYLCEP